MADCDCPGSCDCPGYGKIDLPGSNAIFFQDVTQLGAISIHPQLRAIVGAGAQVNVFGNLLQPLPLHIKIVQAGSELTALFQFSRDDGRSWSGNLPCGPYEACGDVLVGFTAALYSVGQEWQAQVGHYRSCDASGWFFDPSGARPLIALDDWNNLPTVKHTGQECLVESSGLAVQIYGGVPKPFSFVGVFAIDELSPTFVAQVVLGFFNHTNNVNYFFMLAANYMASQFHQFSSSWRGATGAPVSTPAIVNASNHAKYLVSVRYDGALLTVEVNGTRVFDALPFTHLSATPTRTTIGASFQSGIPISFLNGSHQAMALWTTFLSDAQLLEVTESFFKPKFLDNHPNRVWVNGESNGMCNVNNASFAYSMSTGGPTGQTQICSYYTNNARQARIMKRELPSKVWFGQLGDPNAENNQVTTLDAHKVHCSRLRPSGLIFGGKNMHGDVDQAFTVSLSALGIVAQGVWIPGGGTPPGNETQISYPAPLVNGIYVCRQGRSGDGISIAIDTTTTPPTLLSIWADGLGLSSQYLHTITQDKFGFWHLWWTNRRGVGAGVDKNSGTFHAKTLDFVNFVKQDGTPYALPITPASAENVFNVAENSDCINQVGAHNHPLTGDPITCLSFNDGNGIPDYNLIGFEAGVPKRRKLGILTTPFTWGNAPTVPTVAQTPGVIHSRAGVACFGNDTYLVIAGTDLGPGIWCAKIAGNAWTGPVTLHQLDDNPVWTLDPANPMATWECPTIDTVRLERDGILSFPVGGQSNLFIPTQPQQKAIPARTFYIWEGVPP